MGSIVVANSNPDYAKRIASVLHSSGLYVGGIYTSGAQLIHFANQHYHGGVAVCSVKLRDMACRVPSALPSIFSFSSGRSWPGCSASWNPPAFCFPFDGWI